MIKVAVSACLLGIKCRYDGKCSSNEEITRRALEEGWIPICPEVLGGLSIPRTPAEIRDGRVITKDGKDVTEVFRNGAVKALEICKAYNVHTAVLKERSPSCGCGVIYDGSFTGRKITGNGITAELFLQNGIRVLGESDVDKL